MANCLSLTTCSSSAQATRSGPAAFGKIRIKGFSQIRCVSKALAPDSSSLEAWVPVHTAVQWVSQESC